MSEPAKYPSGPASEGDALREVDSEVVQRLAPADVYDPVIEAYKKDVDRTLIRENLKLTHEQRIKKMVENIRAIEEYRRAQG